jgi:hypothetical protein
MMWPLPSNGRSEVGNLRLRASEDLHGSPARDLVNEYPIAPTIFRDTIPAKKTSATKSMWIRLTTLNPPTKWGVGFRFQSCL